VARTFRAASRRTAGDPMTYMIDGQQHVALTLQAGQMIALALR
jgi:hypothetical protein